MSRTILFLSLSGSVLALALFALKPLLKHRAPAAFSYYIWLLVLLRLTIPFGVPLGVTGWMPTVDSLPASPSAVAGTAPDTVAPLEPMERVEPPEAVPGPPGASAPSGSSVGAAPLPRAVGWLDLIWAVGAAVSFLWYAAAYWMFLRRLGQTCTAPDPLDAAVFETLRGGRRVRLQCGDVDIPIQMGVLRPVIVLPRSAYAASGMERELRDILLHELTHYRRRDVLYKWFAVLARSLHWFNPLVYLVKRELDQACERACDEAVIRTMTREERTHYGKTLLSMAARRRLPTGVTATTMSEGKKHLKGRLRSIMTYQKKTKGACALLLGLTVLLTGCALFRAEASGSKAAPEETLERVKTLLATAEQAAGYAGEYDMDGHHVMVSFPITAPPPYSQRLEVIKESLNHAGLSEFVQYDQEPIYESGAFLIPDGDSFCKVEVGYCITPEEISAHTGEDGVADNLPERPVILTFTFEDTGDSVRIAGPVEGGIDTVVSLARDDNAAVTLWQTYASEQEGYNSGDWLELSGYAYKIALVTRYEDGAAVDGPSQNTLAWSAYTASVIESAVEYLEPIRTPEQFQVDREVTILESGYGVCAFDLERNLLRVGTEDGGSYYDLTCMDKEGLAVLHLALSDYG